jgi:DICT domain-containing protein
MVIFDIFGCCVSWCVPVSGDPVDTLDLQEGYNQLRGSLPLLVHHSGVWDFHLQVQDLAGRTTGE